MTWRLGRGVLLALIGAMAVATLQAQPPWVAVSGQGFNVKGALLPSAVQAIACDVATAAHIMRSGSNGTSAPVVVAVDGRRAMGEWLPEFSEPGRGNPLGAYWKGLFGHHIVLRADSRADERLRRVLHEYAHFVTQTMHPTPPRWLDEGLSEVWEHASVGATTVAIGGPVADHLRRLRSGRGWIPLSDLVSAASIPEQPASASAMFYAESWLLVHYLLFEQGVSRMDVTQLLDPGGWPSDDELRTYAGTSLERRDTVARWDARQGLDCPGHHAVRPMAPRDVLMTRARALADGGRPDAAAPLLVQVLARSPDDTEASEVLAFVHFSSNRPVEAAHIFDRLIAGGTASHVSYYYRAVLAGAVPEASGGKGPVPVVDYLRKAISLRPDFLPAAERLGELVAKTVCCPSTPTVRQ